MAVVQPVWVFDVQTGPGAAVTTHLAYRCCLLQENFCYDWGELVVALEAEGAAVEDHALLH
jgi:hypothetical protein